MATKKNDTQITAAVAARKTLPQAAAGSYGTFATDLPVDDRAFLRWLGASKQASGTNCHPTRRVDPVGLPGAMEETKAEPAPKTTPFAAQPDHHHKWNPFVAKRVAMKLASPAHAAPAAPAPAAAPAAALAALPAAAPAAAPVAAAAAAPAAAPAPVDAGPGGAAARTRGRREPRPGEAAATTVPQAHGRARARAPDATPRPLGAPRPRRRRARPARWDAGGGGREPPRRGRRPRRRSRPRQRSATSTAAVAAARRDDVDAIFAKAGVAEQKRPEPPSPEASTCVLRGRRHGGASSRGP